MQQKLILTGTSDNINALMDEIKIHAFVHNVAIEASKPESGMRVWIDAALRKKSPKGDIERNATWCRHAYTYYPTCRYSGKPNLSNTDVECMHKDTPNCHCGTNHLGINECPLDNPENGGGAP